MKAAVGKNKFTIGFNRRNLNVHFSKHKKAYPGMSKQDYDVAALTLIQQPCGGNIRGYVRENGQIVRYNRLTNDLVIGNNSEDSDVPIGIATMHKVSEYKFDRLLKEEAYGNEYF